MPEITPDTLNDRMEFDHPIYSMPVDKDADITVEAWAMAYRETDGAS